MHDVGIALLRNEVFCGLRFAAGINRRPREAHRFRFEHRVLGAVVLAGVIEARLGPGAIDDIEPFRGSAIAIIVALEIDAIHLGFLLPPRGNHIERETAVADAIDIRGLLGEKCR